MFTKQETFELVVGHLRKQGRRSGFTKVNSAGRNAFICFYRHPDKNLKCAIGSLIPDAMYRPDMELCVASTASRGGPAPELTKLGHDLDFCRELQNVHDSTKPYRWEARLRRLAKRNGLTYAPPAA